MKLSNVSILCAAALLHFGPARAADGPVEPVTIRAVAHFGFDRTTIDPRDRERILAEVGKLKDVTWQSVITTGHTDSVGKPGYNERLAEKRAQAVKTYLVGKGLDAAMIDTAAKAAAAPVADNDSEAGRAKNRRAEIEFRGIRVAAK